MACVALKALTKAAGVAIVKAQKEAFDAVHKLLEDFDVDSAVIEALEELTAKFTAGKPKRAKTGYNLFIAEHMKESKAEKPDLKSVDHMKLACAAWKDLADDEQEKYREMARGLVANGATSDTDTVTSVPLVPLETEETEETEDEVSVPVKKAKAKAKVTKAKATVIPLETEETVETEETETVQKPVRKAKGKAKKAVE